MSIFKFFSGRRIALDLGTANTLVWTANDGIVLNEPSMVAIEKRDGVRTVAAFGADAKVMLGKTPDHLEVVRPMRDGVIADIEIAEEMIKHFIAKAIGSGSNSRCREIVICVPSGATSVERRAIRDAASNAGGRDVYLINEPVAAAIGAGLSVTEPKGSMVVDIGGGTTEIAVLSLGGIVFSSSLRVGGDRMDEAVGAYLRRQRNLVVGEATAERLKSLYGNASDDGDDEQTVVVRGHDLVAGVPSQINVSRKEIALALTELFSAIAAGVRDALEQTPPELAADILEQGVVLTGGGALLAGLPEYLSERTNLPFRVADDALDCVVLGTGAVMQNPELRVVLSEY